MQDAVSSEDANSGWRGSREVWMAAAKSALLENGVDAVKIQPLASTLKLSRTSFYWFFKDRAALLDALLDDWDSSNTGALTDACKAYAETIAEAVLNVTAAFIDENAFDPRFDFAIRGWAHRSDRVKARVAVADEVRLAALQAMFTRFGFSEAEADVRARTIYLVQIGYISLQTREDLATRLARVPAYVKTFCGENPSPGEMARFSARLGAAVSA
ncbi:TetR/AcrR family transcriptional regulator [Heliomarina baculiformis]|uniref:TetR/AcrR family transcriptional regulator n=1 Tax=Heliomarina baculiformis TaxID=2872036 RepID=UPI001EE2ED07|nr:TetR/AcrR family transcriptional regulator [Heliomarina baculiformis]